MVASEPEILKALTEFYGLRHSVKRAERDLRAGIDLGNLEQFVRMKNEAEIESSDQHIVNAVEFMLQHAFDSRASDIHVEPKRDFALIRFRIDGVLHDIQTVPKIVHAAIVSRIKTMSRLDIAEKRRPQDGRIKTARAGREVELRVSTLPVAFGEKVVMRIFDPDVLLQDLAGLGFYPEELAALQRVHQPAARHHPGDRPDRLRQDDHALLGAQVDRLAASVNITTIEDPIEMVIEEFNQTAVQPKIGIDFANALRHILRQDPDVIMVGEIRDRGDGAVRRAGRAHRPPGLLHPAHQRRGDVDHPPRRSRRRALPDQLDADRRRWRSGWCGGSAPPARASARSPPEEAASLRLTVPAGKRIKVKEGQGCHECRGTGYLGRSGIFEMLPIDETIKSLILENRDAPEIKREAVSVGMRTLRQSALRKLAEGLTTFEEVVRVTGI